MWGRLDLIIPSSRVDPGAHTALSLTAGKTPDAVDCPPGTVEVLASHGLIGAAALSGVVPLAEATKPTHFRLLMRQRVMDRHRVEVSDALAEAGIRAVLLKGPSAARWYRQPDARTSTDVDLLVSHERVGEAVEIIERMPAVANVPADGPAADKRHIRFQDPTGVTFTLDLHWHLYSYHQLRGRADSALAEIWSNLVPSDLGWELPIGAELTFLSAHAVLDHRFRLVLFKDLAEVAHQQPDWDEVARFADRHGLRSLTWAALRTAQRFAAAEIPDGVLDEMRVGTMPERAYEAWIGKVDPVRFDGRSRHPLNLATVLLHDDRVDRIALVARAPRAFGRWKQKEDVMHRRGVKRALVTVTSNSRRGAEVFGETLSGALRERGWDARFVCLSVMDEPNVSAAPVRGAGRGLSRLAPAVVSGLRAEMGCVDVVLLNGSATLRYGVAAALGLPGRPGLVYSSIGEPAYWASSNLRRAIQRVMLSRVDLVAAVSEATADQLEAVIGVDSAAIRYAPTGVEVPGASPADPHADGPLRLVWVGSLSNEKRPALLFDVLEEVNSQVHIEVVGDGPLREEVERRAMTEERMTVIGAVTDVAPLLRSADALVQTSATEGLPGVVMEAAALGTPSVAFDVGGTGELVIDGVTGRLIPSGRTEDMARVLDQLGRDRSELAAMGAAARLHVNENFDLNSVVDRWEAILEAAMDARQR